MTAVAQEPGFTGEDEIQSALKEALEDGGTAPIHVMINRIRQAVTSVRKGEALKDDRGHVKFTYRGIDTVVNALGPVLRECGVLTIPQLEQLHFRDVMSNNNKRMSETRVQVRYVFIGPLGDTIEAVVPGESLDYSDKGSAGAMSVAWRIALIQVFSLPTDEPDPDERYIERGNGAPRSTADEAADRERPRLSRPEMLEELAALMTDVEKEHGAYAAADRIVKYCATAHKVDIVTERGEEGQVEMYDLAKLNDGQLTFTLRAIRRQLALAKAAEAEMGA